MYTYHCLWLINSLSRAVAQGKPVRRILFLFLHTHHMEHKVTAWHTRLCAFWPSFCISSLTQRCCLVSFLSRSKHIWASLKKRIEESKRRFWRPHVFWPSEDALFNKLTYLSKERKKRCRVHRLFQLLNRLIRRRSQFFKHGLVRVCSRVKMVMHVGLVHDLRGCGRRQNHA